MTKQTTAYGRPNPTFHGNLTLVGRGTPMGELLRRYWHPVALAADASQTPRKIRVLGEDLILFRDGAGRAGLLYPRCIHRGASLYYGRVEEDGIRCCYHGWKFTADGRCIDQPCEPTGEIIEADDNSIGSGGPVIVPCNWLQHFENVMDPFHVPILHGSFSGNQFTPKMALMPKVKFEYTPRGTLSVQLRDVEGGVHRRVTEAVLPNIRALIHVGVWADSSESVFPSITNPNHTTLITGMMPRKHGVLAAGRTIRRSVPEAQSRRPRPARRPVARARRSS